MFTPRYVKHSKLLLRHAQKYLRYKSDILEPETREEVEAAMRRLHAALRQRDRKQIEDRAEALDAHLHRLAPITMETHWRELSAGSRVRTTIKRRQTEPRFRVRPPPERLSER